MSSINSSGDRKNQDDSVRRARETYQQRETENAKTQKQEVRRLTEAHQAEIQALKNEHDRQMEDLKMKTREALTRRDMEYQKDVEGMREMQREQARRSAADSESRLNRTQSTLKAEIDRQAKTSDKQKEILRTNFEEAVRGRDQKFEEFSTESRKEMQKTNADTRLSMREAHEKETKALVADRDNRLDAAKTNFTEMEKAKNSQIASQKRNFETQSNRLTTTFHSNLENEKEGNRAREAMQREGFDAAVGENRERYRKALDKQSEAMEMARGELSDSVNSRLNTKVTGLEDKVNNLEKQRVRERVSENQKKQLEMKNMRNAFSANIEDLEKQRRETVNAANQQTAGEIKKVIKSNDQAFAANNRFFQEKIGMNEIRNEEKFQNTQAEYEAKSQTTEISNNSRFAKLENFNEMEREKMRAYFEQATTSMRENFETTLRDMRLKNKAEQDRLFNTMSKQSRDNEAKWQTKVESVSLDYEKKLAELNDRHQKELKEQRVAAERQLTEQSKKSQAELSTQNLQLNHRISKNDETHKRELEDLKRRHAESLDSLARVKPS